MKILIIYDSLYGNTEKVALAVASIFSKSETRVLSVNQVSASMLKDYSLLIFASPTHGGRAKEEMSKFIAELAEADLKGHQFAVFDTRMAIEKQGWFLKLIINFFGYAAPKIAQTLQGKGAKLLLPAEGFFVTDKEGPLFDGEINRAKSWAEIIKNLN